MYLFVYIVPSEMIENLKTLTNLAIAAARCNCGLFDLLSE